MTTINRETINRGTINRRTINREPITAVNRRIKKAKNRGTNHIQ